MLHLFASSQLVSLAEWAWQHYDDLITRISAYHMQLCTFSILQDTNSQDWSNSKPFYEVNQCIIIVLIMLIIPLLYHQGERISFHIQMWRLHILGLRADLWSHAPHQAAVRVLRNVLSGTLDTLVRHYSSVTPSSNRQQQYK